MLSFKPAFSLSSFIFSKKLFSVSSLSALSLHFHFSILVMLLLLLLLLSHFSHVRLCATPETAAHKAPPIPGILQARTLEWVAISFSNA